MHVGKNLLLNGAVIIYEDFLGDHMVSGGNQGEGGGGQASLPGGGTQRKLTANHMGSLEHYRASWGGGGGGAEESLIVTHPRDK